MENSPVDKPASKPEHERAKEWRQRHGWTLEDLSKLTGYSSSALLWFERGLSAPNTHRGEATARPTNVFAWQRYRLVCAAVDHQFRTKREFAW